MDELDELREELVEARAEAERLAEQLADREARAEELVEGIASLRHELEAARLEAETARDAVEEATRRMVERYRSALLQATPEVPAELVHGDTMEDVDQSIVRAREVVARVREQVQTEPAARIPAGSPGRGMTDVETLSAAEKIRLGVSERMNAER
jgi:chromosome segregation ATPase